METRVLMPEGKLEIRRDRIEVGSYHEKDPKWSFTDKQGHEHRWHIPQGADDWKEQKRWKLPTLRAVGFTIYYPDGETGCGVHYYCKRCGELIHPGYRMSPFPRFIAGPAEYYLGGVMIDKAKAESILKTRRKFDETGEEDCEESLS